MADTNKPIERISSNAGTQWIVFALDETEYLIRSAQIMQIEMVEKITPVPNTHPFVRGVAYLRGQVVPVIDLRLRLGLPAVEPGLTSRIIVTGSAARAIGLLVDNAREVIYLDKSEIVPAPEVTHANGVSHVSGVAVRDNRMMLVLNVEKVLQVSLQLAPLGEINLEAERQAPKPGNTTLEDSAQGGGGNGDL